MVVALSKRRSPLTCSDSTKRVKIDIFHETKKTNFNLLRR